MTRKAGSAQKRQVSELDADTHKCDYFRFLLFPSKRWLKNARLSEQLKNVCFCLLILINTTDTAKIMAAATMVARRLRPLHRRLMTTRRETSFSSTGVCPSMNESPPLPPPPPLPPLLDRCTFLIKRFENYFVRCRIRTRAILGLPCFRLAP